MAVLVAWKQSNVLIQLVGGDKSEPKQAWTPRSEQMR